MGIRITHEGSVLHNRADLSEAHYNAPFLWEVQPNDTQDFYLHSAEKHIVWATDNSGGMNEFDLKEAGFVWVNMEEEE